MASSSALKDLFPHDALSARTRFRLRTLVNCLFVLGIFVPAAIVFARIPFGGLFQILTGATLFFLFFFVWEDRAIWMACDTCKKPIATNTPWECGYCHKENTETSAFPFVHRCKHCQAEPKAYKCHHGGHLIFLTEDKMEDHYAQCLGSSKKDDVLDEETSQAREKRAKEHALGMAALDEKLEAFKERKEALKKLPPKEAIQADYEKGHSVVLGVEEFYAERLKQIQEEFKDNPPRLERELAYLKDWRRRKLQQ
jgi:hypothetical protein